MVTSQVCRFQVVSSGAKLPRQKLTFPNTNTDAQQRLAITKMTFCYIYKVTYLIMGDPKASK